MKLLWWIVFAILAIGIGLYTFAYALFDEDSGLLDSKSTALPADQVWNLFIYLHIYFGGFTLRSCWSRFMRKFT